MKHNREVRLGLEVLEDRTALNGAFGGAIGAGVPVLTPFNEWMLQPTSVGLSQPAVQNAIANFYNPTGQLSNALNQLQSFQAAQTALLNQVFSEMQSLLQALHINTIVML
jgi:hypothetical protein